MGKIKAKVAAALAGILTLGGAVFGFVGCAEKEPTPTPEPTPNPSEQTFEEMKADVSEFLDGVYDGNFTANGVAGSQEANTDIFVDDGVARIEANGVTRYLFNENGTAYVVELSDVDGRYHKNVAEDTTYSSVVDDFQNNLRTMENSLQFDEENSQLFSTSPIFEGDTVEISLSSNGDTLTIEYVNSGNQTIITNVGNTAVSLPQNVIDDTIEKPVDEPTFEEMKEDVNEFFQRIYNGGNFTMIGRSDYAESNSDIYYDGTRAMGVADGTTQYVYEEDGQTYMLTYNSKDKQFHKTIPEDITFNAMIANYTNMYQSIENNLLFDEENNQLLSDSGIFDGETVAISLSKDGETLQIKGETHEVILTDVGSTTVTLPENVIDDTVSQEYVCENGVWNYAVLANTIENWFIGRDYYEYYAERDIQLTKIIELNIDENNRVHFTAVMNGEDGNAVKTFYFDKIFDSSKNATPEELVAFLNSQTLPVWQEGSISIDYASTTTNSEQQTLLSGLTRSVLSRFSEQEGVNISQNDILFAYKTPRSTEFADAQLGYRTTWNQVYLVNDNGELKQVSIQLTSSTMLGDGDVENVINNTNYWRLSTYSIEDVNDENLALFNQNQTRNVKVSEVELSK